MPGFDPQYRPRHPVALTGGAAGDLEWVLSPIAILIRNDRADRSRCQSLFDVVRAVATTARAVAKAH
jgi:hypothetical protein